MLLPIVTLYDYGGGDDGFYDYGYCSGMYCDHLLYTEHECAVYVHMYILSIVTQLLWLVLHLLHVTIQSLVLNQLRSVVCDSI